MAEYFPRQNIFPNNLPVPRTSFVGRQAEINQIKMLVVSGSSSPYHAGPAAGQGMLVTLTGPGGTGKTRLAQQAAFDLLSLFPDGAWFVELAPLADPNLVPLTVAGVLGLRPPPEKPVTALLEEYLAPRELILILDNCEHMIDAVIRLVEPLLQRCPNLHILATSREILGVAGEAPIRVPSLSVPPAYFSVENKSTEDLLEYESVRLFCDRAATSSPKFTLTAANAARVVQICQRLDGIPLAIELAAARIHMFTVDEIAARLDQAFRLLTGGSRTALPRHRTLQASMDWSYNLLPEEERQALARLSVFAGGWTIEAAEAVLPDENDPVDALTLLAQLVDKSLVQVEHENDSTTRYRLLETIQQYAFEKLLESGGIEPLRTRHLDYFAQFTTLAEPRLRAGDQVEWFDRLETDLDNISLALEWARDHNIEAGLRMVASMLWFWQIRGRSVEGLEWLDQFLTREVEQRGGEPASPSRQLARARALNATAILSIYINDLSRFDDLLNEAQSILEQRDCSCPHDLAVTQVVLCRMASNPEENAAMLKKNLEIFRAEGDVFNMAEALLLLCDLALEQAKDEEAQGYALEHLAQRRKINDLDGLGYAYQQLGVIAFARGQGAQAGQYFHDGLECFLKVGNQRMITLMCIDQAVLDFSAGEQSEAVGEGDGPAWLHRVDDAARLKFQQLLAYASEHCLKPLQSAAQYGLGAIAAARGQYPEAAESFRSALQLWKETKDNLESGWRFMVAADLAYHAGQDQTAAVLLGAADFWDMRIGSRIMQPGERARCRRLRQAVSESLGSAAFDQAHQEGRSLTFDQALDRLNAFCHWLGQAVKPAQPSPPPLAPRAPVVMASPPAGADLVETLSPRELEVLRMLCEGASNLDIARKLYIDVRTVKSHNTHIFAKLEVRGRLQAVAKAKRMGIV